MAEFEGGVGPPCVRGIEVDEVGEEMDCLPGGAGVGAGEREEKKDQEEEMDSTPNL